MLVEVARQILSTRPDGSVPGRSPVNDSHFQVMVIHCDCCQSTRLRTEDGALPLDPGTPRDVLMEAERPDLIPELNPEEPADDSAENDGPPTPSEQRDAPTSETLARMRIDHETRRDSDARASRPRLLADVIGQRRVVTNLEFAV